MKILVVVFAILLVLGILLVGRWKCAVRKVWKMTPLQRVRKINELAAEFGYYYEPSQDIFLTRIDAWQRRFGYEWLYDKMASRFHMVYDCFPVYFDYGGKSWLIEFWKGQYGINIGSEIGVYNVNYLVPEEKRKTTHYQAVTDSELLDLSFVLYDDGTRCYTWGQKHWWLAAFRMGVWQEPSKLRLRLRIIFPDVDMAMAFVGGLKKGGYPIAGLERNCTWVTVDFAKETVFSTSWWQQCRRRIAQWENRCCVSLFHLVTRPFYRTVDKILFLYYQLPICVRRLFYVKHFGRCRRCKK